MADLDTYLSPDPSNPRKISKDAAAGLQRSIELYGDLSGITFNKRTGELVTGHQRVSQLKALGAQFIGDRIHVQHGGQQFEFPVRVVDWSRSKQIEANVAANNPHIQGEWQQLEEYLGSISLSLSGEDFTDLRFDALADDLGIDFGMSSEEPEEPPEAAPPKEPITKPGDTWILGRHTLTCGDSLKADPTFDVVMADPPYGIGLTDKASHGQDGAASAGEYKPIEGDHSTELAIGAFRKYGHAPGCWWGANYYASALPDTGGWLVWWKDIVGDRFSAAEMAWTHRTGRVLGMRHQWHGMIRDSERGEKRQHPTQKPVAVIGWALQQIGDGVILDPFAGSGPTYLAAEALGRTVVGYEIDPGYCDVIVQRWEELTSGEAKRQ